MDFSDFLNLTVVGITTAAVYAIAASGLVVTYTTSGIFNFAHGAFGMMAAFLYWQLTVEWGVDTLLAVVLVVGVAAPLFGAVVERVIMRGIEDTTEVVKVVVTVSLFVALIGLATWIWPGGVGRSYPEFFSGEVVRIGQVNVTYHQIVTLAVALAVAILLRLVLFGTRIGVAMRAVVDDRSLAQLNGVRPGRVSMTAWAMGTSLAAVSGVLLGAGRSLLAIELTILVINSFAAAVVGRLRSLPLAFLGALILGLAEAYVQGYVKSTWSLGSFSFLGIQKAVSPALLLIVLVFLPQARLRAGGVQRQREHWAVPSLRISLIGAFALVVGVAGLVDIVPKGGPLLISQALFISVVALSLVPLIGYAGQISLAPMTFAGFGGVLAGLLGADWSIGGILLAALASAIAGVILALPALRLTGIYLALATVAFAMLMSVLFFEQQRIMPNGTRSVPPVSILGWEADTSSRQALVGAVVFALVGLGLVLLRRGSWGRRLAALKDSPVACATLGLNLTLTKVAVFALSAGIAGLAGATAGSTLRSQQFEVAAGLPVTMMAVVGGVGAVSGALIGGAILGGFPVVALVFKEAKIGIFRLVELSVTKVNSVMPGLLGISLGRNPNGIVSELSRSFAEVGASNVALGGLGAGLAGIWGLRRGDVIDGWQFLAAALVFTLAAVPAIPGILERRRGAPVAFAAGLVATGLALLIPWSTGIESNGVRFVAIIALSAAATLVCQWLQGLVAAPGAGAPSPDMAGVGVAFDRSEVMEADDALGIHPGLLPAEAVTHGAP